MKKKTLLFVTIGALFATGVIAVSASGVNQVRRTSFVAVANDNKIVMTLDTVPTALTDTYQPSVTGRVTTPSGNPLDFVFINAKTADGKFCQLAPRGMIYNFAADSYEVKGLSSVKFTGTGTLYVATAKGGQRGGAVMNDRIALTSGDETPVPVSNYFQFIAGDDGAVIESLVLTYSCDGDEYSFDSLVGTYTGVGNDNVTYQLDVVSETDVTIKTLDREEPIEMHGTAQMLSASQVKCTYVYNSYNIYYTVNVSADKGTLTYVSKADDYGGAVASNIAEVNFNRVYNVQDFESYSATGTGFDSKRGQASIFSMTGVRADFLSDYNGSNTVPSPIGGSGWSLMGSEDYLNFTSNKGHNDSKAASFKGNNNSLRYISMNSMYGVPSVIGRGAYLSFWAKGPYSNNTLTSNSSSAAAIKVYAFYNSLVVPTNQTERTELPDAISIPAGSDWTEYRLPLDSTKYYFGFGFFCKQSATTYTVIDDIKIYTASPYAVYTPPVAVTSVTVSPTTDSIRVGGQTALAAAIEPAEATNKVLQWTSSNDAIATVDSNGLVRGVADGVATITATATDGSGVHGSATITVSELEYPEGTFKTDIIVGGQTVNILIAIGNDANDLVHVRISNVDLVATAINYDSTTHEFEITTTESADLGDVTISLGTITGAFVPEEDKLINVGFSDTDVAAMLGSLNGTLEALRIDTYFECDGTTAQLQAQFKRRFQQKNSGNTGGNGWIEDKTNADRVARDTSHYVSGSGAMSVRPYANSNGGWCWAINLQKDIEGGLSCMNIGYWVYNPSEVDVKIDMWVYEKQGMASAKMTGEVTAKAGGWSYVAMGFGTKDAEGYHNIKIYNIQISVWHNYNKDSNVNATGTKLTLDNIVLF